MGFVDTDDMSALLEEHIVGSRPAFEGGFLKVDHVDVTLPNGKPAAREVVRHPGAVAIVALDEQGRVLLVHQYRTALERITAEIPAGKLDLGEDPALAARRELEEETGYTAGRLDYLTHIACAAGYSDEIIHLYMATDLERGLAHPDDDEFLTADWVDLSSLIDDVLDGRIEDSKTVIAALICDAMRHRV